MKEVTFADFAALARRRAWTLDFLVQRFRDHIESPREFFRCVLDRRNAGTVIPFDSVLAFYWQELKFDRKEFERNRRCACGCGRPVFGRQKWATSACRKRAQRSKSRTAQLAAKSA